jgi:hypothetical protein
MIQFEGKSSARSFSGEEMRKETLAGLRISDISFIRSRKMGRGKNCSVPR